MPKRLIDDRIWSSDKVSRLNPKHKAEYPYLLPLALANGSFYHAEPRQVHHMCYAYARPEITVDDVSKIFEDFEQVGLLFIWSDDGQHRNGYFTNIKDRLPRPTDRARMKQGPVPPQTALYAYLDKYNIPRETVDYLYPKTSDSKPSAAYSRSKQTQAAEGPLSVGARTRAALAQGASQ